MRCIASRRCAAGRQVLDPKTLVIAERPGNRRADSLHNIIETGQVGLLFVTPGLGETLRVNGRACVLQDDDLLESLAVRGKRPLVAIGVEVEQCYFQCAKALIRSGLWLNAPGPCEAAADFAEILLDQTGIEGQSVESLRDEIQQSYKLRLY